MHVMVEVTRLVTTVITATVTQDATADEAGPELEGGGGDTKRVQR